jgi:hypothetical protein
MGKPDAASSCLSGLEGAGRKRTPAKEQRAALPPYASVLLENNTPLCVISDILGHVDTDSTAVYLKVDIQKLKECPLDFGEGVSRG